MVRAELAIFVKLPDRAASPVFVGRDEVFRDLDSGIELARLGRSEGTALVVYGAPGAGKTALMHEAKKRWDEAHGRRTSQTPLAVKVDASATVCGYPERSEVNEFILHLHGSNYPVLMLFGGLGNTLDTLERVGLSRTAVAGVNGLPPQRVWRHACQSRRDRRKHPRGWSRLRQ